MAKFVYSFGGGKADGNGSMRNLLGGKGANLAEMAGKSFEEYIQPRQILSAVMSFREAAPHMVIVLLSSETILSM